MSFTERFSVENQKGWAIAQGLFEREKYSLDRVEKEEMLFSKDYPESAQGFSSYCDSLFPIQINPVKPFLGKFSHFVKVQRAYGFAQNRHEGHTRYGGEDYFFHHLVPVTENLISFLPNTSRDSVAMVCAALLHDSVEDTGTTLDEIRGSFGYKITRYVDGMINTTIGNHQQRHIETMAKLSEQPLQVRIIKCFDIMHNAFSMGKLNPRYGIRWYQEKLDLLDTEFLQGIPLFLKESLVNLLIMGKDLSHLTEK